MLILFFMCTIPMYYLYDGWITLGGFGLMYSYLAGIAFIFICFWRFLIWPDMDRAAYIGKLALIAASPYLFSLLWSMGLWVFNLAEFRIITRGLFFPVYQLIAITVGACAVYCFGHRGAYYMLASLAAAILLIAGGQILQGGVREFFYEYAVLIKSGSKLTGPMMKAVEKASLIHGLGLFLLYLLLQKRHKARNFFLALCCLPLFLMGYKRSAILALFSSAAVAVIFMVFPKQWKRKAASALSVLLVAGGLIYLWLIFSGLLETISNFANIDSMGRIEMYRVMKEYCRFSPAYLGRGMGFVSYMIGRGLIDVGYQFAGDIHNDMLRQYIELGMAGFLLWGFFYFIYKVRGFLKYAGTDCACFAAACSVYCFVCYLTENMYYRFSANSALAVVLLAYAAEYGRRKDTE